MKFNQYRSFRQFCGKHPELKKFNIADLVEQSFHRKHGYEAVPTIDPGTGSVVIQKNQQGLRVFHEQVRTEEDWFHCKRPYYAMYPGVVNGLSRVKLDIDSSHLHLPVECLEIRFAEGHEHFGLRAILAAHITTEEHAGEKPLPGIAIYCDFGEADHEGGPIMVFRKFPIVPGTTVDGCFAHVPNYGGTTDEEDKGAEFATRMVLACCLLGQDDDLVKPDVLKKDAAKLTTDNAERLQEKAQRRGKYGWLIGSDLPSEVSPHYRRPHFGIRWTGQGRKVARLTAIKGSVVHRDKITQIPTGFQENE